jgi:tetratricopeptide (TPR) repeat protein
MRKVNWKLVGWSLAGLAVLAAGVFAVQRVQSGRIAGALLWQADRAEKRGELKQAVRFLRRYLEFEPNDLRQRARLARALADPKLADSRKDREKALFVLEQVLARDPDRHDLRRPLARLAIELGQFDLAREHLRVLEGALPRSGQVQDLLGQWHEAQGRHARAEACYRKAVALSPHRPAYRVRLALLLRQKLHRLDEAARVMAEARKRSPRDAAVLLLAAGLAEDRGDRAAARRLLGEGLRLHPHDQNVYKALAGVEIRAGRRKEALDHLRKGIQALPGPEHRDLLWTLANLLLDMRRDGPAQKEIANLRRIGLLPEAVTYLEGRLCMCRGQWARAARLFEGVRPKLEITPALIPRIDRFLGQCYEQLDEPVKRLGAYERAVARDPKSAEGLAGLASALWAKGRPEDALLQYRRLSGADDVSAAAWTEYAKRLIEFNRGSPRPDWKAVTRVLQRAAKADPKSADVVLLQGEALAAQNRLRAAEDLLLAACVREPKQVRFWVGLIALAENRGDADKAGRYLKDARKVFKDAVELRLAEARHEVNARGAAAAASLQKLGGQAGGFPAEKRSDLFRGLADLCYEAGDISAAAGLLAKAAALAHLANDLRLRLRLFDLYLQAGDGPGMDRVVGQVRRLEGAQGVWWRYGRASYLIWQARQGQRPAKPLLDEASGLLEAVAFQRPAWSAVPLARAEIAELRGQSDQARTYYRQAVNWSDNDQRVVRQMVRLGQSLAERGERSAEAERKLRQAVEVAGTVPDTWACLIRYLAATNQRRQADDVLRRALAAFGPDAPLGRALCFEGAGRVGDARAQYRVALQDNPQDVAAARAAAGFFMRANLPGEAEPLLRRIAARQFKASDRDVAWARRGLAVLLAAGGSFARFQEALRLMGLTLDREGRLAREEKLPPADRDENQRARARVLASQSSRPLQERALAYLEDLRRRQALRPEDQFLLARLYEARGDAGWPTARRLLAELVAGPAGDPGHLAHFAQVLLTHGRVGEAGECIAKLARREAERGAGVGALGSTELKARALEARGRKDEAYALLRRYAEASDGGPRRRLAFAGFLARWQRLSEALDQCEKASRAGAPAELVGGAAVAMLRSGRPTARQCDRVQALLEAALAKQPASPVLLVQRADLEDVRGKYDRAEKLYRAALAADPNNVMALNNLAWLLAQRAGKGDKALPLIERAIELLGPRPDLLDTRALVYLAQGRAREAVADLERATHDAPTAARYFHLARALNTDHRSGDARAAFRKAKDAGLALKRLHPIDRVAYRKIAGELETR